MSRIDQLIESYRTHIQMPLRPELAAPQRIWFALYPAADERRLVNRVEEFEIITKQAGYSWFRIDLKGKFSEWIDSVDLDERTNWFKNPGDIDLYAKTEWKQLLMEFCSAEMSRSRVPEETVFALTGLMELYDYLHVSDVLEFLEPHFPGYTLVFFPGEREGNVYRFLDARVGWNYLAVPILSET